MNLKLLGGGTVTPSVDIGKGGEGVVSRYVEDADQCFKRYTEGTGEGHRQKLQAMIGSPPEDRSLASGHRSLAWPQDLVVDQLNHCVGFVMPLLDDGKDFYSVKHPVERLANFPTWTWGHLVRVGTNLATVVDSLHQEGYVIGDLNPRNIRVTVNGQVSLVDLDSIQVTTPHEVFRCPVGEFEYAPGEVLDAIELSVSFQDVERSQQSDNFSLTLLLYELLMFGRHPFKGKLTGIVDQDSMGTRDNIRAELSPLLRSPGIMLGPKDPEPRKVLPPQTIDIMARGISRNPADRPSAVELVNAFKWLSGSIVQCRDEPRHQFSSFRSTCPWCEFARTAGQDSWIPQSDRIGLGARNASPNSLSVLNDAKLLVRKSDEYDPEGFLANLTDWISGSKRSRLWGEARLKVNELIVYVSSGDISAVEALGWLGEPANQGAMRHLDLTLDDLITSAKFGGQQVALLTHLSLSQSEMREVFLGTMSLDPPAVALLERELIEGLEWGDVALVNRLKKASVPEVRRMAWIIQGDGMARRLRALSMKRFPSVASAQTFVNEYQNFSSWLATVENASSFPDHMSEWKRCIEANHGTLKAANWANFRQIIWQTLYILSFALWILSVIMSVIRRGGATGVAPYATVSVYIWLFSFVLWLISRVMVKKLRGD